MTALLRGQVVWFDLGDAGRQPAVVVSNNHRNRALGSALAARITTSGKPGLPSIVDLATADPLQGRVLCDDLIEIYDDEVRGDAGALSTWTMQRVNDGLRHALGLDR